MKPLVPQAIPTPWNHYRIYLIQTKGIQQIYRKNLHFQLKRRMVPLQIENLHLMINGKLLW